MQYETIEAGDIRPGDRFYDRHFYAPDKWVPVRSVEDFAGPGSYVLVDLGYVSAVLHKREAVSVKRSLGKD